MASPAWFTAAITAIRPTTRYSHLFSMSDGDLARRGYDREGLKRSFITGLSGF